MSNYPIGAKWPDDASHLLFDLGFSYALLLRIEDFLADLLDSNETDLEQAVELLAALALFRAGRLGTRKQIYDCAEEAANKLRKPTEETN